MRFRNLFGHDRAVSPVIGVILMVAITVILAAVIGSFVLGMAGTLSTTPQAQFGFDVTTNYATGNDEVEITHVGGDTISGSALTVSATVSGFDYRDSGAWQSAGGNEMTWKTAGDAEVSAGSSVTIGEADFEGETVRVIYDDPDSDETATLAKIDV